MSLELGFLAPLWRAFAHGFPRQDRIQGEIDVVVGAPDFLFLHESAFRQRAEIFRGGEARDIQVALYEFDLRVGVGEQVVDEILAIERVLRANPMLGVHQGRADGMDGFDRIASGSFNGGEHVKHPLLPSIAFAHGLQQAVIVRLGAHDMAAEIEHVDNAPGAAVTVLKWMDAFELVMDQRHLDKWVGIKNSCVVYEALEVAHKRDDGFRLLRGA